MSARQVFSVLSMLRLDTLCLAMHSWITLDYRFYGYSDPVSTTYFISYVRKAEEEITKQSLADHGSNSLGTKMFRYSEFTVYLVLMPSEQITRRMWARVPYVIRCYSWLNGWQGAQFIILWEGLGHVGYGSLTDAIVRKQKD